MVRPGGCQPQSPETALLGVQIRTDVRGSQHGAVANVPGSPQQRAVCGLAQTDPRAQPICGIIEAESRQWHLPFRLPGGFSNGIRNVKRALVGCVVFLVTVPGVPLFPQATVFDLDSHAWHDNDGNGQRRAGESGLEGVPIDLLRSGALSSDATSDSAGVYRFSVPLPDACVVRRAQPGCLRWSSTPTRSPSLWRSGKPCAWTSTIGAAG